MKHRLPVFLGLILVMATWAPAQQTYNLPQVANGVFAGGSIRTTFVLFNNSDQQSVVTIMISNDAGGAFPVTIPGLGTDTVFEVTLEAGQTRFLETDGSGDAQAGSAQVVATSPLGVAAIFTIRGPGGEFLTESGVGVSEALTEFAVAVDATGSFNTGLAIRNLEAVPVTATLTLFNSQGLQEGDPTEVQLPANGHVAQFVSGDLFDALPGFRGKLTVQSTGRLAALTLRQNSSPLSFTTLPVVAADSGQTEFLLPQVANGGGTIRTTFVLFNLSSSQTANVSLRLTDDDGGPFSVSLSNGQQGSEFNLQIPPCGALFLDTDSLGQVTAGAARISSDVAVGVAGIFTLLDGTGRFLTETGVGASPEITAATIPVDLTGGFNTGIALFNNNSEAATVNLTFYGANGASAARALRLEPLGSTGVVELGSLGHDASFVPDLIPGAAGTGSMAIEATLPVAALTLRQNSSPLTFTTLPVAEGVFGGGNGGETGTRALPAVRTGLAITSNRVLDQTLAGGFELSGTVTSPRVFDPVLGVFAISSGGQIFTGVVDTLQRRYRVFLPAGVYRVRFGYTLLPAVPGLAGSPTPGSVVTVNHDFTNVVVEGDTIRNFTLPEPARSSISGRVSGLQNLPPELRTSAFLAFSPGDAVTAGYAILDGEGDYAIDLAEGDYSVSLLVSNTDSAAAGASLQGAAAPVQVSALFLGGFAVSGDNAAANFTTPAVVRLSGVISQPQTPQLPEGAGMNARDVTFAPGSAAFAPLPTGFSFGAAEPDGSYEATLVQNRGYVVTALLPVTAIGTTREGVLTMPIPPAAVEESFGADAVRNFNFPVLPQQVTLSGRVTGPAGPVSGASVTASSSSLTGTPNVQFTASTFTDSQGNFSFTVLSGTDYQVSFDPDPGLPPSQGGRY